MIKLSIPQPCHEDWNKMNPNEQGRHCNSCAKTVVDFTNMSDDDVKNFFLNKTTERVCGRFKQKQLQQIVIDLPQNIFRIEMPIWKRFLVASLVVFSTTLFSCNTSINGQLVQNDKASEMVAGLLSMREPVALKIKGFIEYDDTTRVPQCTQTMGIVAQKIVDVNEPEMLKGDVAFINTDTVKPKKCEPEVMGKLSFVPPIKTDTVKPPIKNPQKADATDCSTKTYY